MESILEWIRRVIRRPTYNQGDKVSTSLIPSLSTFLNDSFTFQSGNRGFGYERRVVAHVQL